MYDANLEDERERNWRMVSEDNGGGVDVAIELLHDNRLDVYVN